jgi:hypothetical protein
MAIIRPKEPAVALQTAFLAMRQQDVALMRKIPEEMPHNFVGWMPAPRADVPPEYILDRDGFIVDDLMPGDSLVVLNDAEPGDDVPSWYVAAMAAFPGPRKPAGDSAVAAAAHAASVPASVVDQYSRVSGYDPKEKP